MHPTATALLEAHTRHMLNNLGGPDWGHCSTKKLPLSATASAHPNRHTGHSGTDQSAE